MHQRSASHSNKSSISRNRKLLASIVAVPLVSGLMQSQASAADALWDTNGATTGAGTGALAPGNWGVDSFWTTTTNGTGTQAAWIANDVAIFSAGTDATGAFTITVTGTQVANGLTFQEGTVTLSGGQIDLGIADAPINVAASRTAIIDSTIGGTVGLTKTGAGTLVLGAATGYTGVTKVSAGTLHTNSTAALAGYNTAGSVVAETGGTVSVAFDGAGQWTSANVDTLLANATFNAGSSLGLQVDSGTSTYATDITAAIGLTKSGAGTLIIAGNNSAAVGTHAVNAGVLQIAAADRISDAAAVTVATGATFDLNTFNEAVGSIGGAGNVTMGAANLSVGGNPATATLSGLLSGSGTLTKTGTGTQVLSGANVGFSGLVVVNGGTLRAATPGSLPNWSTAGNVTVNSATFGVSAGGTGQFTAADIDSILGGTNVALNGTSSLNINVDTSNTFTYASNVTNPIGLTKTGAGTLTLSGANTYNGGTRAEAGTLRLTNTGALPGYTTPGAVVATAGTVSVHAGGAGQWTNTDLDALIANASWGVGSSVGFNVDTAESFTYNTNITGAVAGGIGIDNVGVTKSGAGSASMGGTNTYIGITRVTGGKLTITNDAALGTSGADTNNTVVSSGAQLELSGIGTLAERIQFAGNGIGSTGAIRKIGPGNTTLTGQLTATATGARIQVDEGTLTLQNGAIFFPAAANATITVGGAGDIVTTSAPNTNFAAGSGGNNRLIKDGTGTLTLNGISSFTGGVTINGGTVSFSADTNSATNSGQLGRYPSAAVDPDNIILNGGKLRSTNPGNGSTFAFANRGIQIGANGGGVEVSTPAIALTYAGVISPAAGVTDSVLIKTGPGEFRAQGAGLPNMTYHRLHVKEGLFRLGFNSGVQDERGFGAVPGSFLENQITLESGGLIGASFTLSLHANRGIELLTGGGGFNTTGGSVTVPGVIKGVGQLLKPGSGTLTLNGNNTYSGGTTLNGGTIAFNHDNAAGTGDITITPAAATVMRANVASVTMPNNVIINAGASTVDIFTTAGNTLTLNGVVSGAGPWARGATASTFGDVVLGGASPNTFSGAVTVPNGTLIAAKEAALGAASGTTTVSPGAALGFQGNIAYATPEPVTVSGTGLSTTGAIVNRAGTNSFAGPVTLAADTSLGAAASSSLTLSGVVSGTANLTKVGTGTIGLTGSNTYTGDTTISAGTLSVNSQAALGTSTNAIQVGNGALQTSADVAFTRNLSVNHASSAFDSTTFASTIGSVAGTGGLTKVGTGTLTANQVKVAGGVTVSAGTLAVATNGTATGTLETTALTVDGILAMNDNDFIVDYTGASPEFTLRDKVKAFRDSLAPGGPAFTSGISYTPGANDRVIAVAEKSEWSATRTEFNGIAIDSTTIIGKHTYYGDANLDGKVDSNDYVAVDVGLGSGDSWVQGDFNFSGTVTSDDYVAIDTNLGKGVTVGDPLAIAELKAEMVALHTAQFGDVYVQALAIAEEFGYGALVPEPGAISVLGIGMMGLLGRRRRGAKGVH